MKNYQREMIKELMDAGEEAGARLSLRHDIEFATT
jgi:queuine/archaeosine tRNA-ribosyltransferase